MTDIEVTDVIDEDGHVQLITEDITDKN